MFVGVVVRSVIVFFFGIIILVAVITPAVTIVDIAHTHPAELRATAALHVVAAKHPLYSVPAFRTFLVAPAFEQFGGFCIKAELVDGAHASWMSFLPASRADARFAFVARE